ncbi:hypothetical protein BKA61DRAFT_698311 [Leptodontidium sp. MPI-SDFR-AT-0119]|nr:hypothetical protein BKA61DRAFT_698311 [Leptodontidium sp. MPI-SDFR-AT-0119]
MARASKLVPLLILSTSTFASAYNEKCLNITQTALALLGNSSLASDRDSFAFGSTYDQPIITLEWCEARCEGGSSIYDDVWTRLFTWPIPIIILVTSFLLAPTGKSRFFAIVHLFGDTIHSTWSLIDILERRTALCTSILNLDSLWPGSFPSTNQSKHQHIKHGVIISISLKDLLPTVNLDHLDTLPICYCDDLKLRSIYRRTAAEIVDSSVHDILRTWIAILVYIAGVALNFFPDSAGAAKPSGGTLASALQLAWLLPTILLSNAVGQPHSLPHVVKALRRFEEETRVSTHLHQSTCNLARGNQAWAQEVRNLNWKVYLDLRTRTMSIPSGPLLNPRTSTRPKSRSCGRSLLILVLSILPLTLGFTSAFVTLFSSPTWFSCRHIMLVSIFALLILSFILTILITHYLPSNDLLRYKCIIIKDLFVAACVIILLLASTFGIFNSCWCRSSVYSPGKGRVVRLNPTEAYGLNGKVIYPSIVAATLFLEICVFWAVMWLERIGVSMWKWSDVEKQEALLEDCDLEMGEQAAPAVRVLGKDKDMAQPGVSVTTREFLDPLEFESSIFSEPRHVQMPGR